MARAPERRNWLRASRIASAALGGYVFPKVGLATHYHTQAIWPRWGKSLVMTNIVGAHIFHRWRGRWGMPDAFRSEEHTSELQSLMRISYAVFCLKKKKQHQKTNSKKLTTKTNTQM